jgi:hypothetical protein
MLFAYLLKNRQESTIPIAEKITANNPKTPKSIASLDVFTGSRISILEASVAYDTGLTFATSCSQLGMMDVGKSALLANRSGRFSRFITAI